MNWPGPTFTDSGGFQVLSLGAGFKKVLAMNVDGMQSDDVIAPGKNRLATVDDDGVTFKSHLDGSMHRFSPEISMRIQHQLGADIIFAFDECTTLMNTRPYQERSVDRTQAWAERCIDEHRRLTAERVGRPYQALFGVVQGAQYEDLRRQATRDLVAARASTATASAGRWRSTTSAPSCAGCCEELPEDKPRHLLGISEPDDMFTAIENGADTFDCVSPSRVARNGSIYSPHAAGTTSPTPGSAPTSGRWTTTATATPARTTPGPTCTTCSGRRRCSPRRCPPSTTSGSSSGWSTGSGRASRTGSFADFRADFLGRYYAGRAAAPAPDLTAAPGT